MKDNNKVFWKGIEELGNSPEFVKTAQNEFPEFLPVFLCAYVGIGF